jgi:hypothetical protein
MRKIQLIVVHAIISVASAFSPGVMLRTNTQMARSLPSFTILKSESNDYEKKNAAVSVLSNFIQQEEEKTKGNPIDAIDFSAPKFQKKIPLETLAQILDYELYTREWFVTGNVNPIYFPDQFEFQDPDVKLVGIENYARGVNKLFDQNTSRAEIISVEASNGEEKKNTITVRWRLSGKVNIGPFGGLTIKPYICITDFTVDPDTGLIVFQEDFFEIPQWDILLSALFPFLIGKVTSEPAPPVKRERYPMMPINFRDDQVKDWSLLDGLLSKIQNILAKS